MEQIKEFTLEDFKHPDGFRELNRQLKALSDTGKTVLLPYGDSASQSADTYLSTMDGVVMTASIGYHMHRAGSIVGHSTLLNITTATSGDVTFEVKVNDASQASLENEFLSSLGTGVTSASVTEARHTVSFAKGDIITVFANETGTMVWTSVVGYAEVIFDE